MKLIICLIAAPLFVFQWLFDEAQMRADNVAAPVTPHQWNYIHAMGGALRSSLDNVTAVFAPSCIGHAVLSKREWLTIKIDEISLPTALRCWEHSTRPRKKRHDKLKRSTEATISNQHNKDAKKRREKQQKEKQREKEKKRNNNNGERKRLTKAEREERKRLRHEQQKRREERRNRRKNNLPVPDHESNLTNAIRSSDNATDTPQHIRKEHKRKRTEQEKQKRNQNRHKKRQRRKKEHNSPDALEPERELQKEQPVVTPVAERRRNSANKINRRSGVPRVPERCSLRLLERCSWPQCNHSCPTLTNPATGEEMRFLELLSSFGLDIEAVATALGVDMQTLNNMDRTELVNLLTQQVS